VSAHKTCVKRLSEIVLKSSDAVEITKSCYDKILSCSKKESCADRAIKFFCLFVSMQPERTMTIFMQYLLERSCCLDKGVRFRSCQSLSVVLDFISSERPDYEIDGKLWKEMQVTLLPRLRDKCPTVRTWGLRACTHLQDPGDNSDPMIPEIIRMMSSDSSKDVRIAAVETVVMSAFTLGHVVDRLRDVKTEVRVAVITKLGDAVEFVNLSQKQRVSFVKYGLGDRDDKVRSESRAVILKWLRKIDSVPKMLKMMGLRLHCAEAELLAWGVIEEAQKENASAALRSLVLDQNVIKWGVDCSFGEVGAADVFWTLARCSYFHKNLPAAQAYEQVEHLLPDTVVLCRLLDEGAISLKGLSDRNQQVAAEMLLTFLLMMTNFVDSSDVAGGVSLISLCDKLLADVELSDEVIDAVLAASSKAHAQLAANQDRDVIGKMIGLALQLWPSSIQEDDVDESEAELHLKCMAQLRSLYIIAWCVQNRTRDAGRSASGSFIDVVLPLVMESLQQPNEELRMAAIRCLGLMGVASQTHCERFAGIVVTVASNTREDLLIRCQAVESLADMAMVHSDEIIDEEAIVRTLLRLMDSSGECVLQRTAAEAAAKLLFSGRIVKSPALFAQLVNVFFHPFEEDEEQEEGGAVKGSAAHLDQILSVFFPAFFGAGGDRGRVIAVQAVTHLISDACRSVRDEVTDSMKISQMVEHLIGWCQFLPSDSSEEGGSGSAGASQHVERALKTQVCATCLKEMLLLGGGRPAHKFLMKELCKALAALAPCTAWMEDKQMVRDQ
jgi:hypothetical protein